MTMMGIFFTKVAKNSGLKLTGMNVPGLKPDIRCFSDQTVVVSKMNGQRGNPEN